MHNVSIEFYDDKEISLDKIQKMFTSEFSVFDLLKASTALCIQAVKTEIKQDSLNYDRYNTDKYYLRYELDSYTIDGLIRLVKAVAKKFSVGGRLLYYEEETAFIGSGCGEVEFFNHEIINEVRYFSECQESFKWFCKNIDQYELERVGYRLNARGKWEGKYLSRNKNGKLVGVLRKLPEKDIIPHWYKEEINRATSLSV